MRHLLETVCRLHTVRVGRHVSFLDKAKISKGDNKLPKALDREALDKLKVLRFEDLEEEWKRQGTFSFLPVMSVQPIAT